MGAITGLIGANGGAAGTGFSAPNQANIQTPVTSAQANQAGNYSNTILNQQQQLLGALAGQNGIGNQSSVYNQLQGVANGTGPNPAAAQLAQATGANTANQAALMAGQRGSGANAGLIARQAAQQGAANQQAAAGQAATMQANQSLNALGQLGGLAGQQVSQQQAATNQSTSAAQNQQQMLLNAIGAQNNAAVGSQSSVNSGNAQLAGTSMQGQQGLIGGTLNSAGSLLGLAAGGEVPVSVDYNNQDNVDYDHPPSMSADSIPTQQAPSAPKIPTIAAPAPQAGPQSSFGQFLNSQNKSGSAPGQAQASQFNYGNPGANQLAAGMSNFLSGFASPAQAPGVAPYSNANPIIAGGPQDNSGSVPQNGTMMAAKGGKVPVLLSPGEQKIPAEDVKAVAEGKKDPLTTGKRVPGMPKYKGNDYRNDTYKDEATPGDLIIPNKVMQSKNPHWEAMKFVHAHTRNLKKGK